MIKVTTGDVMTFGQKLRQAREQLHLSQEAAAKAIEKSHNVRLSAAYLSMIENGVKTNLTVKVIKALLAHFNLPLHAAASLFIQAASLPAYEQTEAVAVLREMAAAYPAEQAQLPAEAKQVLQEFSEFLHYKYSNGNYNNGKSPEQVSYNTR